MTVALLASSTSARLLLQTAQITTEVTTAMVAREFFSNLFHHPFDHIYQLVYMGIPPVGLILLSAYLVKRHVTKHCPLPES